MGHAGAATFPATFRSMERRPDLYERLTVWAESLEGTADIAFVRLMTWCALALAALWGWTRLW